MTGFRIPRRFVPPTAPSRTGSSDWSTRSWPERGLDDAPDIGAALLRDVAAAVFEGANVPDDRNRPAPERIRFLIESILAGRSPVKRT
ncbi:hypothetical protein [Streptomyces scabiei]|uniref:hypothetical protein n=1 Tax=Streptomyces scabiei TaxID=1930 RepID=UPI000AAD82FE|nr:hypothetical protein [Streptomyces scabiei]